MTDTDPTPTPEPAPTPDPNPTPEPTEDLAAEVEKWKHFAREHEKTAKANAEAARKLAEIEDAAKSQAEKDAEAKTAAEQRAAKAEADLARLKVATAAQLPPELAERLVGSNEQEMAEDAARLKALMAPATPPIPGGNVDQGPQGPSTQDPTLDEAIAAAEAEGNFSKAIALKNRKLAEQNAGS